jgi:phage head maturation protease
MSETGIPLQKPFAGFPNFDACLAHMMDQQGYDEETARKVCGKLQAEAEGTAKSWHLEIRGPITTLSKSARVIAGYANVAVVDSEGDLITVDAWKRAAERFMASGFENVNLKHGNVTIGQVIAEFRDSDGKLWKTHVDDNGFFIVVKIRDDLMIADKAWELIETGKLREFSISGSAPLGATRILHDPKKGTYREISDLELYEVTVCEHGVNPGSAFMILKSDDGRTLRFQKQERPPKEWWDRCISSVSEKPGVDDPAALCGWIWYHQLNQMQNPDYEKLIEEYKSLPDMPPKSQSLGSDKVREELLRLLKYATKEECLRGIEDFRRMVQEAPIIDLTEPPTSQSLVSDNNQKEKGGKLSEKEKDKADNVEKQPPSTPAQAVPKELGPAIIEKLDLLTQAIEKLTSLVAGKAQPTDGEQKGATPTPPPATPSQEDLKAKAEPDAKKLADLVEAEVKKRLEELAKPGEKRGEVPGAGNINPPAPSGLDAVSKALDEAGWDGVEALATQLRKSKGAM